MTEQPREHFLDALDDLPPADQLRFLATAAGSIIRGLAKDPAEARDAVDKLLVLIERAAGLRL